MTKGVLDNFFDIRDIINKSDVPLSITDISEKTGMSVRTVQRYAMRLASERLVDFRAREGRMGYEYMHLDYVDKDN